MSQVKLALNELTLLQQIELARQIAPAMTGNPSFPTPNPPLGDLLDYAATAESTINAQKATAKAAQNATINARNAQIALMNALTAEGSYVQSESQGDEAKILSAGMKVRSDAAPVGPLPAPENLSATTGDMPGEIDLHWNRLKGASSYVPQFTTDPMTNASVWTPARPAPRANAPSQTSRPARATGSASRRRVPPAKAPGATPPRKCRSNGGNGCPGCTRKERPAPTP